MAADPILAKAFRDTKTKAELQSALTVLVDSVTEPDDVVNQYLEGEGWTMKVKSMKDRMMIIETIQAAIRLHDGTGTGSDHTSHFMDFSTRRIE